MRNATRRWAEAIIAVGALSAAVATQQVAAAASNANGIWQESVRAQTRYTSSTIANARKVYVDEAPLALAVAVARIRAEELERHAGGSFLHIQAAAERAVADKYRNEFDNVPDSGNGFLSDGRYIGPDEIPKVGKRLADLQAAAPDHAEIPSTLLTDGNASASRAQAGIIGMIAGALLSLFGFILWTLAPRRREAGQAASDTATATVLQSSAGGGTTRPRRPTEIVSDACRTRVAVVLVISAGVVLIAACRSMRSRRKRSLGVARAVGVTVATVVVANAANRHPSAPSHRGGPEVASRARPDSEEKADAVRPIHFTPDNRQREHPPPTLLPGVPSIPTALPHSDGDRTGRGRSPLPTVVVAVLAVIVTALQLQASLAESKLLAEAGRGATVVSAAAVAGVTRTGFETYGKQTALLLGQRADELRAADADNPTGRDLAEALAAADDAAAARIGQLVVDMSAPPTEADGIDPLTRTLLSNAQLEQQDLLEQQQRAAANAETAGRSSDRLVLILLFLTLTTIVIETRPWAWRWRRRDIGADRR